MKRNQKPSQEFRRTAQRAAPLALALLTAVNLLNYIDRYIFSALLPAIKGDLGFSDTELGLLGTAFLLAYVIVTPLFGRLGDVGQRSKVMSLGVAVWSVATAFSGICTSFLGQLFTRATVGLGESAYVVIAPSTIADHFPKHSRGKVFAIYSGAIPVGSALGFVLGGWLEPRFGWQKSFFVVGVPGLLLALILFFLKDPPRGQSEDIAHSPGAPASAADGRRTSRQIYLKLFKNGGFLFTSLGYAAYTFVLGGIAFWMPSYLVRYFDVSLAKANIQFGALTVVGGFAGTLLGGFWADRIERRSGNGFLKVSVFAMLLSAPLLALAISFHDYNGFLISMLIVEITLFMPISPLDAALISYVKPVWRASATGLNIMVIHVLGDGISRTLLGVVSDQSGLRSALGILPWFILLAGLLWAVVLVLYWQPMHWPAGGLRLPKWQAHRGLREQFQGQVAVENTLAAFQRAAQAGAQMVECDVRWSADRQVVIFHDENLKRLAGRSETVADLTAAQLKELAGVCRLQELLEDPSQIAVNIEIKSKEGVRGSGLEIAIEGVIASAKAESRVLISSFNPLALRRMAKALPMVPRALLVTEDVEEDNKIYLRKMWLGVFARVHMLNLDEKMISAERMETWSDRGLPIAAWTVNDTHRATELSQLGVQSQISDHLYLN